MKVIYIKSRSNIDLKKVLKGLKFKGKLGLVTTIQHTHKLKEAQELIPNSVIAGQILGCNASLAKKIENKVDAFLYIGSGNFHPIEIALETSKPVYWANPFTNKVTKISNELIEKRKKRIKGAYLKYLTSNKVGVLVSTKSGQNHLNDAVNFKKSVHDKKVYIFLFNTLNINGLEDFPDIDCWVNTACPRIAIEDYEKFNKPVINLSDLKKLIN
ncbi:hypothetical protein D6777_01580 [Candidatus Woesearchaeota archaeon]|nr:MAG: hypothetical protein D6777_01580 [Candidatus Woesearchaeota archaeon]